MSSTAGKQDMTMDDILASIRSYVSEGQTFPKKEVASVLSAEKSIQPESYKAEVIELTDEVIPIDTVSFKQPDNNPINLLHPVEKSQYPIPDPKPAQNAFETFGATDNPFNKLQSEIVASTPPAPSLSSESLLNQLATPLIKGWLDVNLRKIVEEIVEKEIQRIRHG